MSNKIKIKAHIPVQQYGFFEVKGTENDLKKIEKIYNDYAENPVNFDEGVFQEIKTFTDETILFNHKTHTYTDLNGKPLLSGSAYKKSLEKPFDVEKVSQIIANKYNVDQQTIRDMWKHNGETSRTFGNAIHLAMEQYFKFKEYAENTEDKEYHLPNHEWLRNLVLEFPDKDEDILPEVLISDVKNKRAGRIDGLKMIGDKKCTVIDFKSDGKIEDNVDGHFNQLSFYAHILQKAGWKVEKLEIWNYVDKWKKFENDVLELKGRAKNKSKHKK